MNLFFFNITVILYFAGAILFLLYVVSKREFISRSSLWVTGVGFISHSIALSTRMLEAGHIPLSNLYEALSFFTWGLVLVFLIIEYLYKIHILGSFILPLAFIFIMAASILPNEVSALDPLLQSRWFGIHTTLSLLGIVAFAMAFVCGIMYLIQERLLKSKRFNALYYKLPSLDMLDHLNQRAISIGFPLLTLGIISGSVWAEYAWGSYWSWEPKQTFSLVTWLFYLVVLHGRLTVGWRAKKAAYLAIIGFLGVIFTFIGVNLLIKGLHSFV
ncbi:MAG: c-type cytochrome biogenesis protein CcsB [Nitrospirota bacterium]